MDWDADSQDKTGPGAKFLDGVVFEVGDLGFTRDDVACLVVGSVLYIEPSNGTFPDTRLDLFIVDGKLTSLHAFSFASSSTLAPVFKIVTGCRPDTNSELVV